MQFEKRYSEILLKSFEANKDIKPLYVSLISNVSSVVEAKEKYIGGVYCTDINNNEAFVCVNHSSNKSLLYYPGTQKIEYFGDLKLFYSYACGVFYPVDGCVYGFPRISNRVLKIDINQKVSQEIDIDFDASSELEGKNVKVGHHYGGVLIDDIMISPPRYSNYILTIDLRNYTYQKIYFKELESNLYNSAILHPNGNVYFTPLGGSAFAEYNPRTEELNLIGERMDASFFGGTVYADGCIYCFSQGRGGLFRIDVNNKNVELIADKLSNDVFISGCIGAITHFNGNIYSIPGATNHCFEYNPRANVCREYCIFDDGRFNNAKWAGGALFSNGDICMSPAFGRFAAAIKFNKKPYVSEDMLNLMKSGYFKAM